MEVLYHIRPYFLGIFPYIGLIYGYIYIYIDIDIETYIYIDIYIYIW